MKKNQLWPYLVGAIAITLWIPKVASAHTGVGDVTGFWHGLEHPIGGLDHILAMVAVGLAFWATFTRCRARNFSFRFYPWFVALICRSVAPSSERGNCRNPGYFSRLRTWSRNARNRIWISLWFRFYCFDCLFASSWNWDRIGNHWRWRWRSLSFAERLGEKRSLSSGESLSAQTPTTVIPDRWRCCCRWRNLCFSQSLTTSISIASQDRRRKSGKMMVFPSSQDVNG
jgi:hypothetical protein